MTEANDQTGVDGMLSSFSKSGMLKQLINSEQGKKMMSSVVDMGKAKLGELASTGKAVAMLAYRLKIFVEWAGKNSIDSTKMKEVAAAFWARFTTDLDKVNKWRRELLKFITSPSSISTGESQTKITAIIEMSKGLLSSAGSESESHDELFTTLKGQVDETQESSISLRAKMTAGIFLKLLGTEYTTEMLQVFLAEPEVAAIVQATPAAPTPEAAPATQYSIGAAILHACNSKIDGTFHVRAALLTSHFHDYHCAMVQSTQLQDADRWSAAPIMLQNVHASSASTFSPFQTGMATRHPYQVVPLISSDCNESVVESSLQLFSTFGDRKDEHIDLLAKATISDAILALNQQADQTLRDLKVGKFQMDMRPIKSERIGMPTGIKFTNH